MSAPLYLEFAHRGPTRTVKEMSMSGRNLACAIYKLLRQKIVTLQSIRWGIVCTGMSVGETESSLTSILSLCENNLSFGEDIEEDFDDDCDDEVDDGGYLLVESETEEAPKKKRIRKKRTRRPTYVPRIVKHDIRRHYGAMIANITNSFDLSLTKSFFETYGHKDFRFQLRRFDVDFDEKQFVRGPNHQVFLLNMDEFVKHEHVRYQLNPDQTIKILETTIRTRSDSERSILNCRAEVRFTRMYDFDAHPKFQESVIKNFVLANRCVEDGKTSQRVSDLMAEPSEPEHPSQSEDLSSDRVTDVAEEKCMRVYTKHQPLTDVEQKYPNVFDLFFERNGTPIPLAERKEYRIITTLTIGINERRQIDSIEYEKPEFIECQELVPGEKEFP